MKLQFPILEEVEKNDYANYRHLMFTLLIALNAHCVVETGLGNGHSTRIFLESLSQFDDERELHTFELEPNMLVKKDIDNIRLNYPHIKTLTYWYLHLGKSVDQVKIMHGYPKIDLLYLDSDHSYNNVMSELNAFLPYLSEKAWIMLDDTFMNGEHTDVYNAAFKWANENNWRHLDFTEQRGFPPENIRTNGKMFLYRGK